MDEPQRAARFAKFNEKKREEYLSLLRQGVRRCAAATAVGVNRHTISNLFNSDPEFAAAIEQAEMSRWDHITTQVEDALVKKCLEGNMTAIIFYLQNRSPDRWQDRRNVAQTGTIEMNPEQAKELLKQRGLIVEEHGK